VVKQVAPFGQQLVPSPQHVPLSCGHVNDCGHRDLGHSRRTAAISLSLNGSIEKGTMVALVSSSGTTTAGGLRPLFAEMFLADGAGYIRGIVTCSSVACSV